MPGAAQARGQTQDPSHFTPCEDEPNQGLAPQRLETAVNNLQSSRGRVPSSPSQGGLSPPAASFAPLLPPAMSGET